MNPDLPKLLDVQAKDRGLATLADEKGALEAERRGLDAAVDKVKAEIAGATRTAEDFARRRDQTAEKLEAQRAQQEKRRLRLEQERSPRIAAQLLADVELAKSILAQEESEWMRLADDATARAGVVAQAEQRLAALQEEQAPARGEFQGKLDDLERRIAAAQAERDAAAALLDRTLRTRYDRLRGSRTTEVLVPAAKATCTACYTAIPRSRIGKLEAEGLLLEGCEMCGALIYLPTETPA